MVVPAAPETIFQVELSDPAGAPLQIRAGASASFEMRFTGEV